MDKEQEKKELPPDWQKKYQKLRFLLFFFFAAGIIYLAYLVLFPSRTFSFSFRTPQAAKNTIINPRYLDGKLVFDVALSPDLGNFSEAEINFILEKNSSLIQKGSEISARKSYQAFFYPEGEIIAKKYKSNPDLPFPDGSLIASQNSVFITSGSFIYPIDNQLTFQAMGFDWNDVIKAASEDLEVYEKKKLFTVASPHPDGTVFAEKESGKYYLIQEGKRKELVGTEIISSYLHKTPIIAEEKSLTTKEYCTLKKKFNPFNPAYFCRLPLEKLTELLGNDYQYETQLGPEIKIKEAQVVLKKKLSLEELKLTLSKIKKNIIANLYGQSL